MKFFSGFSFKNEQFLFKNYIEDGEYNVSGFSYGAIKSFQYALSSQKRVNKIQLFSPAFFQTKNEKFKRTQLLYFSKDEDKYINNFLKNVFYPSKDLKKIEDFVQNGTIEELKELLFFEWKKEDFEIILSKGVVLEIFIGEKDKIVDSKEAMDFFSQYGTVYFIKDVGHLLS